MLDEEFAASFYPATPRAVSSELPDEGANMRQGERADIQPSANSQNVSQTQAAEFADLLYPNTPQPRPVESPDNDLAELLYPASPKPSDAVETPQNNDDETPLVLAEVPPEVQALRDLPERRLYDIQAMLRDALPDLTDKQCEAEGINPADARLARAEIREIAADLDLGAQDICTLGELSRQVRSAQVDPITQREGAVEALNREFGNGAYQAWLDARALVARDPRVGKMIEAMGLGDDADTIVMLAKKARSQRVAGKFKGR